MRVTIEDVAAHSAVSVATVSRAMRGLPNVSPATRARVMASIAELGYRPDPNASRLATGKSGMVAVAATTLQLWYTAQIVAGVEAVLSSEGVDTMIVGMGDGGIPHLVGGPARRVDGLLILDIEPDEFEVAALAAMRIPWVLIGGRSPWGSSVWIDNAAGGALAARHLFSLGHSRIGVIGGNADRLRFSTPLDRLQGFVDAHRRSGVEFDQDLVVSGNFSLEGGRDALVTLMSMSAPPTAVFCLSDDMAFGALQAAREMGLRIPQDLTLVGFDDQEVSEVVGLTTIHQDPQAMAAAGVRLLLDDLSGSGTGIRHLESPLWLVVRTSSGLCSTARPV